jgi:hypothetical protein
MGRNSLENVPIDEMIILKWSVKRDAIELDSCYTECGLVAGSFENDMKPSGFMKGGKFRVHVSDSAVQTEFCEQVKSSPFRV